jgi:threonine/homoserine/homoserine lactone efflux protein
VDITFLITSLIVVASPGTGVLYTLAAGLSRGPRASVVAAFGCTLGIVPHLAAAIMGLAALLYTSALAFETLKYLGVAYLIYMAFRTLRDQGALHVETGSTAARSSAQVIVSAIVVNLLNPKLSIFFFAFLPQFVRADDRPTRTDAPTELHVHGAHVRRLRWLWALCRTGSEPRDRTPARRHVDAPFLRRRVRRARSQTGAGRALAGITGACRPYRQLFELR